MANEPPFDCREHELLVGLLVNLQATRSRILDGGVTAADALREILGNLAAYESAMADE